MKSQYIQRLEPPSVPLKGLSWLSSVRPTHSFLSRTLDTEEEWDEQGLFFRQPRREWIIL